MARPLTGKEKLYASENNKGRATILVSDIFESQVVHQTYVITGMETPRRELDVDTATSSEIAEFLATFFEDMRDAGWIKDA